MLAASWGRVLRYSCAAARFFLQCTAMTAPQGQTGKTTIGWREWIALPQLGILAIKPKIDTGARSSSLHAFNIETFTRGSETWVRFDVHPIQRDDQAIVQAEARVLEFRQIRSSSGH